MQQVRQRQAQGEARGTLKGKPRRSGKVSPPLTRAGLPPLIGAMLIIVGLTASPALGIPAVNSIDVDRFGGTWYVMASNPGRERLCHFLSADFTPNADRTGFAVAITCRKGTWTKKTDFFASLSDGPSNATLTSRIFLLKSLEIAIVDVAPDYGWAVLVDSEQDMVWIISRTPTLDSATLQGRKRFLTGQGVDASLMIDIPHRDLYAAPR